jgi:hypothetical protein
LRQRLKPRAVNGSCVLFSSNVKRDYGLYDGEYIPTILTQWLLILFYTLFIEISVQDISRHSPLLPSIGDNLPIDNQPRFFI